MHPRAGDWFEFVDGSIATVDRAPMAEHLEHCRECRDATRDVRRLVAAFGLGRAEAPSDRAVRSALAAFRATVPPAGLPAWARELARRAVRLVSDTQARPELAFAGTRTASVGRRLRFESENMELDVMIESGGDGRRLVAQLLSLGADPEPIADAHVFVTVRGNLAASSKTDDHGQVFSEIAVSGRVDIWVVDRDRILRFSIPDDGATA
jgi:hypothetical protein